MVKWVNIVKLMFCFCFLKTYKCHPVHCKSQTNIFLSKSSSSLRSLLSHSSPLALPHPRGLFIAPKIRLHCRLKLTFSNRLLGNWKHWLQNFLTRYLKFNTNPTNSKTTFCKYYVNHVSSCSVCLNVINFSFFFFFLILTFFTRNWNYWWSKARVYSDSVLWSSGVFSRPASEF